MPSCKRTHVVSLEHYPTTKTRFFPFFTRKMERRQWGLHLWSQNLNHQIKRSRVNARLRDIIPSGSCRFYLFTPQLHQLLPRP